MLDFLECPKCGSPAGVRRVKYDFERDRVQMRCTACEVALLVKPLDHPERKRRRDRHNLRVALVCFALFAVLLGVAVADACAEQQPLRAALATYAVASGVDFAQTTTAMQRGGFTEANPLLRGVAGKPLALASVKAAATTGIVWGTWKLSKRKPKTALALGIGIAAVQTFVVVHNAKELNRAR